MIVPIFIGIYLTIQPFNPPQSEKLIPVEGQAQIKKGDDFDISKKKLKSPLSFSEIVAISGKVKANTSNAKVSIKDMSRERINTSTNKDGKFIFHLRPGIYTFFILKKDIAYLNKFDGYGYFKSTKVNKPVMNLILIDDEKSLN